MPVLLAMESKGSYDEVVLQLLGEAERLLDAAHKEFDRGVRENRDEVIRDAAEKAWNSIVQATTALLLSRGYDEGEVKTYRQKRLKLEELSIKDSVVRELGLRERFMAREYTLHIRCFYDGEYTTDALKEELEKSRQYLNDIARLLKNAKQIIKK
jgi:uncharacterized protein (UPF0332 family)